MIKNKYVKGLVLGVASVLAITAVPTLPAEAGYSENIIDGSSCMTELSGGVWYNPDEDVIGKDGMIIFGKDSTDASRVISKDVVSISEQNNDLLKAKFTLDFSQLPKDKEFMFAMGLQSVAAMTGEQGNLEIVFGNDGTRYVKILAYENSGEPAILLNKTTYSGNSPKVEVWLSTTKSMTLTVNGKKVYDGSIPVTGEGSVGFLQTGECAVNVKNISISNFSYERPEAPDFEEDFETGYFNLNVLRSKVLSGSSYSPSYMQVENYEGSKVLKINNTGLCYISTKYAYSNFEMTFDIPFYQHTGSYNEDGELIQPGTRELAVCFGADGSEFTNESGYTEATDMFVFTGPDRCYNLRTSEDFSSDISSEYTSSGNPFSVKLSVIDGQVELAFRLIGEETWHTCASYKLTFTPTGNIAIWAPTGSCTNYAIDNIKVINKDKDAKIISVDYKSSKIDVPENFKFVPQGLNYKSEESDGGADVSYAAVYVVGSVCLAVILLTTVVCAVKNKKKGVRADEKK